MASALEFKVTSAATAPAFEFLQAFQESLSMRRARKQSRACRRPFPDPHQEDSGNMASALEFKVTSAAMAPTFEFLQAVRESLSMRQARKQSRAHRSQLAGPNQADSGKVEVDPAAAASAYLRF